MSDHNEREALRTAAFAQIHHQDVRRRYTVAEVKQIVYPLLTALEASRPSPATVEAVADLLLSLPVEVRRDTTDLAEAIATRFAFPAPVDDDDEIPEGLDDCPACDAPLSSCSRDYVCCGDCTHDANWPPAPVITEERVERGARAYLIHDVPGVFDEPGWDALSDEGRAECRRVSRAILSAALTPEAGQ